MNHFLSVLKQATFSLDTHINGGRTLPGSAGRSLEPFRRWSRTRWTSHEQGWRLGTAGKLAGVEEGALGALRQLVTHGVVLFSRNAYCRPVHLCLRRRLLVPATHPVHPRKGGHAAKFLLPLEMFQPATACLYILLSLPPPNMLPCV